MAKGTCRAVHFSCRPRAVLDRSLLLTSLMLEHTGMAVQGLEVCHLIDLAG